MYRFIVASMVAAGCFVPVTGEAAAPPSCPPDAPAVIARSITPEKPLMAQVSHVSGTATVRVDLNNSGALVGAQVVHSSGSPVLDKGALDAVKALAFAPASPSCTHIAGSYDVVVAYPD